MPCVSLMIFVHKFPHHSVLNATQAMLEFPSTQNGWRLDVISILAILGENNISLNAPLITLSWTCLLPRLIPAPQGLLTERIKALPYEEDVNVTGARSGNRWEGLNYFANTLHGCTNRSLSVRELEITTSLGPEKIEGPYGRWKHHHEIPLNPFGPLPILAYVSSLASLGMLIWAALIHDGAAVTGIVIMSLAAPLLSLNMRWNLPTLPVNNNLYSRPEVVVLRTRDGGFTVVHCTEAIARMLYFRSERVTYELESYVGILTSPVTGGIVLTTAIVLFGNCTWTMQCALAVLYILLNAAYWFVTGLATRNPKVHWNCSNFAVTERTYEEYLDYTHAIWNAIRVSRSTYWAEVSDALPATPVWAAWLREAEKHYDDLKWDPQEAYDSIRDQYTKGEQV